jgi:tetratricopeptide (TPR) repeat protein
MQMTQTWTGALVTGLFFLCFSQAVAALPITPSGDDEVIEVLPASSGSRDEDRRMRKQLADRPDDARLAVTVARRDLDRAREAGDPRFAGLALAALRLWPDAATAPGEVLLMRATLQQYLHEFDNSVASLRQLLARPGGDRMAQAWLTLATVLRVQGRYAESDAACQRVALAGAQLHSSACLAENAGLRGDVATARRALQRLLADPRLPPATRGWLLTSLAELEQRDGRVAAADAAFKAVLRLGPDSYAAVSYADFLIDERRPSEALAVLKDETRTDAVLLRLAIAGTRASAPTAARDVADMRERIVLANERPDAQKFHGREQAMFALYVDRDAARALALARGDVGQQREALDVLVLAEAARANGDRSVIDEARRLKASLGLHDRRLDALL